MFALGAALVLAPVGGVQAQSERVGNEKCGECHKKERKAWLVTKHARLLYDADDETVIENSDLYAEKLGLDDIESAPECGGCHFNTYTSEEGEQVGSVDCESCHGKASGWVDIHSDYGAKDGKAIEDPAMEDPGHREQRWAKSSSAGMIRPAEIHRLAGNCLECHTGPAQKIVEAGHTPGSKFELVSWLDGEVRHNFHGTNQKSNAEFSPGRRRELYLIGRATDLEHSLLKLAEAKGDGPYTGAMKERVASALRELERVQAAISSAEVGQIVKAGKGAPAAAAKQVGTLNLKLASGIDGSKLAPLDALIPAETKGEPYTR
jgi:hypothetical protein